jgi:hypothetical protein
VTGSIAALHPYRRAVADACALTLIQGRRGKPEMLLVRATEVADLIDELTAAGQDMVVLASQLDLAVVNGRIDLVPEVATRLRRRGETYRDCAKPIGAA